MAARTSRAHHPTRKPDWTPGKPPWTPGPPPWWSHSNPGRWLIIGYAHGWRGDLLDVKAITDETCHLSLRYTDKELRIHMRERPDRGILSMKTPYYCMVEYQEIDEDDPGDHYHHVFHIPSFGPGAERLYYMRGTVGGVLSPSVSCPFQVKYHEESQMITLGIFGEAQTLEGEVKLEEGDKIKLTRDDTHNSIIVEALVKDLADLDDVAGVPADGEILTWDAATGLWIPGAAPGAGFWQHIETKHPTAPAETTITFDSISTAYELLRITGFLKKQAGAACVIYVRLNNDTDNNYFRQILRAEAGAASAFANQGTYGYGGMVDLNVNGPWEALFQNVAAVEQRGFHCRSGFYNNLFLTTNRWVGTARITRIDVAVPGGNQIASNSTLVLEGATP